MGGCQYNAILIYLEGANKKIRFNKKTRFNKIN